MPREDDLLDETDEHLPTGRPAEPEHRNRRRVLIVAGVLLLLSIGAWFYLRGGGAEAQAYRFATVERGGIEATVSATGTLGAVTTVQVGTQVSGQVTAINADYNDRVRRGQLIARIDPTLQEQAVRDAQAGLERSQAELVKAEQDYTRNRQLYEQEGLTAAELAATEYALAVARANAKSAAVALDRAQRNLAYTSIYAPIDGVVIERNVDVGQTVAASLQAPQLFLIANDLSQMQILASVDESDIGLIHEGQLVGFTVQAYPDETFTGMVQQVRLQSTITENVVNYTVVVQVENPKGKLLPGMTATVAFLTGLASDVLMVPNAALRFRPTQAMLAEAGIGAQAGAGPGAGSGQGNAARLWYIATGGKPATVRVRTGITDGQKTEIAGEGVAAGMQVITGVTQGAASPGASSPLQSQPQGTPRPGF